MPITAIAVLGAETWRAPCLWRPLSASLAGGAEARPDHPMNGRRHLAKISENSNFFGGRALLALQLFLSPSSESMGNHDSDIVDADGVG
jgi:hypothetical protein